MKYGWTPILVPGAAGALGLVLIAVWTTRAMVDDLALREPGLDRVDGPLVVLHSDAPRTVAGRPVRGDGRPSAAAGEWPCFRGPQRDAIAKDGVKLARKWPPGGPEVLWRVQLGPGHAGAAVARGRVFVLDYDAEARADTMRCLSLDDGREIWRNGYAVEVPENHGMSRTVPAVWEDCVVSLGPMGHAACWDVETGECRWLVDLVADYGAKVPDWYAGQCPLAEDGLAVLAPCGDAFMVALDCRTGEVKWKTPKVRNWQMTHVSIAPLELAGARTYVYCGSGGVAGVSALDGALLWESTDWIGKMATCPTPVPLGSGRLFCAGGYGAGSVVLQLEEQGGRVAARCARRLSARQFGSEQHTPVFYEGRLYAVRTKPAAENLVCLDPEGNELWNSGRDRFGRGPYLVADGLILALDDQGLLVMAEATPDGYRPLDRFQAIPDAHDAWAPMALAGGRLVLRDLTRMVCIDLAEKHR